MARPLFRIEERPEDDRFVTYPGIAAKRDLSPDQREVLDYLTECDRAGFQFDDEPAAGWVFDHCVAETQDEETDGCRGCPGWGIECFSVWRASCP